VGLRENAGNYTNIGIANLKGDYVTAEVSFRGADGTTLGTPLRFDLGPFGVQQIAHALRAAGVSQDVDTFVAVVRVIDGTAISPYATVIDNVSKDPIFVTPSARIGATYRVPGVIRTRGLGTTTWRSDLVVYNPSATARNVSVKFSYIPEGRTARFQAERVISLKGNEAKEWVDFVKEFLGLAADDTANFANSYVDVTPAAGDTNGDPLVVLGRTYNNQPTGNVGLQLPGFTSEDGVSATSSNTRLTVTGLVSNGAYRSNVALFIANQSSTANASAVIKILDGTGAVLKSVTVDLDAFNTIVQKNDGELFGDLSGNVRDNLTVVIESITGNAPVAAYATLIDQISGDAVLLPAEPTQ
jgi:hypothetical protein